MSLLGKWRNVGGDIPSYDYDTWLEVHRQLDAQKAALPAHEPGKCEEIIIHGIKGRPRVFEVYRCMRRATWRKVNGKLCCGCHTSFNDRRAGATQL